MSTRAEKRARLVARVAQLEADALRVDSKMKAAKATIAEIDAVEAKETAAAVTDAKAE